MKNSTGFTLIEVLVVVAIIALVSSLITAAFSQARTRGRDARRLLDIRQIQSALESYYSQNRAYPNLWAYIDPGNNNNWTTGFQSALSPYIAGLPNERITAYLYSATNSAQKYGLAVSLEDSANATLMQNDGGFSSGSYEMGESPGDCARVGKDWSLGITTNCP